MMNLNEAVPSDSNVGDIKTNPNLSTDTASKSLGISQSLGISVDPVMDFKPEQKMNTDIAATSTALRSVANESNETASLIKPDAKDLSKLEKYSENANIEMQVADLRDDLTARVLKQADLRSKGSDLTEQELVELEAVELRVNELEERRKSLNLNMVESALTGDLPSVFRDMYAGAKENPVLAGLGALGFIGGPAVGMSTLALSTSGATAVYNYDRTLAKTYRDLDLLTDESGNPVPMSHDLKLGISRVSAGAQSGLEFASDVVLKKMSKLWNGPKIAEKIMKKALENPTFQNKLIDLGRRASTASMTEGVTEVLQDMISDFTTSTGETYNEKTGIDIAKAATKFGQDFDAGKYGETFIRSAVTGAAAVGVQDTAAGTFGAGKKLYNKMTGNEIKLGPNDTVVEEAPKPKKESKGPKFNLPATPEQLEQQRAEQAEATPKQPYIIRDGIPVYLTPSEAIMLGEVLPNINAISDYNIAENAIATELLQTREAEKNGLNNVFIDKEKLEAWADTSDKKKAVAELFLGEGAFVDAQKVPVTKEQYFALQKFGNKEFLMDNTAITSTGMTLAELKELVKSKIPKATPDAQNIPTSDEMNTAGDIDLTTPELESAVDTTQLKATSPDEDITNTLQYKQEADAYIGRLNTEEQSITGDVEQSERIAQIQVMRERVQSLRDGLPDRPVVEPRPDVDAAIESFESFGDITPNVLSQMTAQEQEQFKTEVTNAKTEMKQNFKEEVIREFDNVANLQERELNKISEDQIIDDIVNNDGIQVVDTFMADKSLRIDPESLTDSQRNRYSDQILIEDRKVFKKKGMHIEEVAAQMGISPDQLLEDLAFSPSSKQAYETKMRVEAARNKNESIRNTELNEAAIEKTVNDTVSLKKKMLTNILKANPSAGLRLIHSIFKVGDKTAVQNVKINAQEVTDNTAIGKLKPSSYLNASRRHMNRANTAMNKNMDLAAGAANIEKSMVADELFKASTKTVTKLNRLLDKLTNIGRNRGMMEKLKATGHYEAFQALMALIGTRRIQDKDADAIKQLMITWQDKGLESDTNLPALIGEPIDNALDKGAPVDLNEMSYAQVETIAAVIDQVLADSRNEISARISQQKQFDKDMGAVAADEVKDNPYRDGSKSKSFAKGGSGWLRNYLSKITGLYRTAQANDEMLEWFRIKPDGVIGNIWRQVKGLGVFDNGMGESGKFKLTNKVKDYLNERMGAENIKRLNSYAGKRVYVKEWQGLEVLSRDGTIKITDLLGMLLIYGSKDGRNRLSKYGIDMNTFISVVEKYTHKNDGDIVNAVHEAHEFLKPGIENVEKTLRGNNKVEFIEGEPYTIHGKEYKGGYIHFSYKEDQTVENLARKDQQEIEKAIGNDKAFNDNDAARGFTKEGFKKAREKNVELFIETDLNTMIDKSLGSIIANNTMLIPVYNAMRLLNNPEIAKQYTNVMGKEGYKVFKANVLTTARNSNFDIHQTKTAFSGIARVLENSGANFMASKIVGSVSSVFNQFLSFATITGKHIDNNPTVLFKTGLFYIKMLVNPRSVGTLIEHLSDHIPAIKTDKTSYQVDNVRSFKLFDKSESGSKVVRAVVNASEGLTEIWLSKIMGGLDTFNKTAYSLALLDSYMNGTLKGGPTKAEIQNMTESELMKNAYAHVDETVSKIFPDRRLSSAAYVQTHPVARAMVPFFNDARRVMNAFYFPRIRDMYEAITHFPRTASRKGVIYAAGKSTKDLVFNAILLHVYASIIDASLRSLRGEDEEGDKTTDAGFMERWFSIFKKDFLDPWTIAKGVADVMPVVSNAKFFLETDGRAGGITTPTISYMGTVLENARNFYNVGFNDDDWDDSKSRDFVNMLTGITPIPASPINNYVFGESTAFQTGLKDVIGLGALSFQSITNQFGDTGDLLGEVVSKAEAATTPQAPEVQQFQQSEIEELYNTMLDNPAGRTTLRQMIANNELPIMTQDEVYNLIFTESDGDPTVTNKRSGATGIGQFVVKTWNALIEPGMDRAYRYEMQIPDGQIDGRTDPIQSMMMLEKLHKRIADRLVSNGLRPNLENIYIGHHFGDVQAVQLIKANSKTTVKDAYIRSFNRPSDGLEAWEIVKEQNPWVNSDKMTIGQFKDHIEYLLLTGVSKQLKWEEQNGAFDPYTLNRPY